MKDLWSGLQKPSHSLVLIGGGLICVPAVKWQPPAPGRSGGGGRNEGRCETVRAGDSRK